MFLKQGGPAAPSTVFRTVYAPNVLTYAACGLKAFPASVTVNAASGSYGGTTTLTASVRCGVLPVAGATVAFSLNGTPVGEAETDSSGNATLSNVSLGSSADSAVAVGSYPTGVSASFAGTTQFGAGSAAAALMIEKAPVTIDYTGGTFIFDAQPHPATGSVFGAFKEPLGSPTFTYTDGQGVSTTTPPVKTGVYQITASFDETTNYLPTSVSSSTKTIEITGGVLTVRADDKAKTYGAALPMLTATFSGFAPGDDESVLTGTLTLTTEATATSPVGKYAIVASGLSSQNYSIEFVEGSLAVTPAPLTVTAEAKSKIYGAPLPFFTAMFDGFVLGETPDALGGTLKFATDGSAASPVGSYPITPSGLVSQNYSIGFVNGALEVTPAPLTVTAEDLERLFGRPNPAPSITFDGFVNGDTPDSLDAGPKAVVKASLFSPPGLYPIVVTGAADSNYAITHVDGTLTVSPPGRMHGDGTIGDDHARYSFEFAVVDTIFAADRGRLEVTVDRNDVRANFRRGRGGEAQRIRDRFVSKTLTTVVFSDDPGFKPGPRRGRGPSADSVVFSGTGTWNGVAATFEATASDQGEPGRRQDEFSLTIEVGGVVVAHIEGPISTGNIQSNRIREESRR
jgi:hypothetical protein